jgi:ribosomal protein L20A (L18A)
MNWVPNNDSIPGLYYGWKKYYPNEILNLNDSKLNNIEENKHSLAFCPIDTNYFSIINEELVFNKRLLWFKVNSLYYFAITVKKYQINSDVYQYYKDLNVQLEAKNRIFDPISFQVRGNIFCVSDAEEPVLGVFEVSSVMARTYSFSDFQADKSVKFKQIEILDIESIPLNGILYNQYPPFWVYYYLYR